MNPRAGDAPRTGLAQPAPASTGGHDPILIVEEDENVRAAMKDALAALDRRLVEAASAEEGYRLVYSVRAPLALVIASTSLPRMRAGRLAGWIRTLHPEVPFLFTGVERPRISARAAAAFPRDEFLTKPFEPAALASKVRAMLA